MTGNIKFKLLGWVVHASPSPKLADFNIQPDFSLTPIWFQLAGHFAPSLFSFLALDFCACLPGQGESLHLCKWKADISFKPRLRRCLRHWSVLDQHSHSGSFLFSISTASQLHSKTVHTMHIVFPTLFPFCSVLQTRLQAQEPNIVLGIQYSYNQCLQRCFYNETSDSDFLKVGNQIWLTSNCTEVPLPTRILFFPQRLYQWTIFSALWTGWTILAFKELIL